MSNSNRLYTPVIARHAQSTNTEVPDLLSICNCKNSTITVLFNGDSDGEEKVVLSKVYSMHA